MLLVFYVLDQISKTNYFHRLFYQVSVHDCSAICWLNLGNLHLVGGFNQQQGSFKTVPDCKLQVILIWNALHNKPHLPVVAGE